MHGRMGVSGAIAALALVSLVAASPASAKSTHLIATLSGFDEVPAADPDGSGTALIDIKAKPGKKKGEVCFTIPWDGIDTPTAGHIHQGGPGTNGPILVPLFTSPVTGFPNDCEKELAKILKRIANDPEKHYVNIHTAVYPDGAIRGQLDLRP